MNGQAHFERRESRVRASPDNKRISIDLEPGPGAALAARRALDPLAGDMSGDLLDDVRLLVSELVTNSVRHAPGGASGRVALEVSPSGRGLHVEVIDSGQGFEPRPREAGRDGGWGLHLVDRLADRWGVARDGGTRVWFDIGAAAQAA